MNEAPHWRKDQTPVLSDRVYCNPAGNIMLSPLFAHKSIKEPRVYPDPNPWQQPTGTLHFDFAEEPSLPVIEKFGDKLNNDVSMSDRLPIDTLRWGGMRTRPHDDFIPLPQVVAKEGKQRLGQTQQNGESNGGSSICHEAARSEHPNRTKKGCHAPRPDSPIVRGSVMLKQRGTSPEPTSFLWDPSEESED